MTTHDVTVSAETNLDQVGTLDIVAPVGKETVVITKDQGSISEPSASTVIGNTVVKTMTSGQSGITVNTYSHKIRIKLTLTNI